MTPRKRLTWCLMIGVGSLVVIPCNRAVTRRPICNTIMIITLCPTGRCDRLNTHLFWLPVPLDTLLQVRRRKLELLHNLTQVLEPVPTWVDFVKSWRIQVTVIIGSKKKKRLANHEGRMKVGSTRVLSFYSPLYHHVVYRGGCVDSSGLAEMHRVIKWLLDSDSPSEQLVYSQAPS